MIAERERVRWGQASCIIKLSSDVLCTYHWVLFNFRRVLGISFLLECIGLFLLAFSSFFVRSTASEAGGGGGARETGGRSS